MNAPRGKYSISLLFVLITVFIYSLACCPASFADERPYGGKHFTGHYHPGYSVPPVEHSDYYINASNIARISVLIDGTRAKIYSHRGEYFIEGREGREYTLLITNLANRRIKVSAAVDGLDVIDGRRASYDKPGYILTAYSNANIKGWRISDREVASFKFGPISESYAMKMDAPSEIGVMSFGFFRERQPEIYVDDYDYPLYKNKDMGGRSERAASESKKAPAASSGRESSAQSIGTEFGDRRDSRVSHTSFDAETGYPQASVKINYASYEDLLKRGVVGGDIIIEDYKPPVRKYDDNGVYSRPPEDWRK